MPTEKSQSQLQILREKFTKYYSVNRCLGITISKSDAIKSKSHRLNNLALELGRAWAEAYICWWVIEIQKKLGFKNKMSPEDTESFARSFYGLAGSMKVAEISWFFTHIMTGGRGKLYGKLTSFDLLLWTRQYMTERMKA